MQSLLIKPPEVRHCGEAYINRETDIPTCSHIAEIYTQVFLLSVTHVNHTHFSAMQADTSKRVTVTWLLRCKHYMVIASSRQVRFMPGHFSADQTCTSACTLGINNTHGVVDIKVVSQAFFEKLAITGQKLFLY